MLGIFVLNRKPKNKISPVTWEEQHFSLSQQGALLPAQETPLYQNTSTQIPSISCSSCPTSGSLTKAPFSFSHGCSNLSTAQFCWHTCHIPCCSVLASCRPGNARYDLYLVRLLQVSVAAFSEKWIVLNPVLMAGEEIALVSHRERELRHCWFWEGDHSGCLYITTVGLSMVMDSGNSRLKYLGKHGKQREVDRVISCFHF